MKKYETARLSRMCAASKVCFVADFIFIITCFKRMATVAIFVNACSVVARCGHCGARRLLYVFFVVMTGRFFAKMRVCGASAPCFPALFLPRQAVETPWAAVKMNGQALSVP